MSWVLWTALGGLASWWLTFAAAIAYVDAKAGREHQYRLECRDWEEKVAAMRRLHDQEGDA